MTINKISEQQTIEYKIYIAEDGKQFKNRFECEIYESQLHIRNIEYLELQEYKNMPPLSTTAYPNYANKFTWYKVNNQKQYTKVIAAYNVKQKASKINFPEIICIEIDTGDTYVYYLADMKQQSKDFFNKMGEVL